MASLRQLRERVKSVHNIQKITRAMEMVSASKLKRAQSRLAAVREASQYLSELVQRLAVDLSMLSHPLLRPAPAHPRHLYVMIGSDTGLCGSYNERLVSHALRWVQEQQTDALFAVVGKRTSSMLKASNHPIVHRWLGWAGRPEIAHATELRTYIEEQYTQGHADIVHFAYMRFVNSLRSEPTVEQLVPIAVPEAVTDEPTGYIYDPDREQALVRVLERWFALKVWTTILESFTSEHSARMMTMHNATDNARDMIDSLTLMRNKMRQASITRELAEIVGTAEALK
jgi:F-type H+-transporting ATPase subunit gamma